MKWPVFSISAFRSPPSSCIASAAGHCACMALGFLPLGIVAVLLTASRRGFLAALVALAGCFLLLARGHARRVAAGFFALPPFLAALWFILPGGTIDRLATIPEQLRSGDLNQRLNIWSAGWRAFVHAPLFGTGAGSFVAAAHLSPIDTAHNTALSIAGWRRALRVASRVAASRPCGSCAAPNPRPSAPRVWSRACLSGPSPRSSPRSRRTAPPGCSSAIVLLAARLAAEDPRGLAACFQSAPPRSVAAPAPPLAAQPSS